jgi:unsaturated chondroitin disaccharide hydrolase
MWQMYHETGNRKYADIARFSEEKLDWCFTDFYGLHHDVGFRWLPTAVANYKLTGDLNARRRGLHAASLLAGRFNPIGKFIRAWNDMEGKDTRGWAIIDSMLNIPLLYWAFEEIHDPRFKHIAQMHADTILEHFIRPDGSSHHIVEFDPFYGGVVKTYGGQGYENGSTWTRGQAWALYGFVISYIHTGIMNYLYAAKRVAHYFIANIPQNGLIPVDFRQPEKPLYEDSSAAAIAACGLIEIAKYVGNYEKGTYLAAALRLLKSLDEKRCDWTENGDCIVQNCTGAYHAKEHHFPMVYGDYFFIEAFFKLAEVDIFIW